MCRTRPCRQAAAVHCSKTTMAYGRAVYYDDECRLRRDHSETKANMAVTSGTTCIIIRFRYLRHRRVLPLVPRRTIRRRRDNNNARDVSGAVFIK